MEGCSLCAPGLGPRIAESEYWFLVLNHNQNLLGKCFWVLRRHLEPVIELTPAEWMDLQAQMVRATRALMAAFQPDHFNYAFLQNQDRHIHFHIFPRYAGARTFAGLTFSDEDYPGHYGVSGPARRLSPEQYATIAEALKPALLSWV